MVAIDLSVCGDFSALTFAWYIDKVFHFHTEYFFPEGALQRHFSRALYELWARDGWLTLIPGPVKQTYATFTAPVEVFEHGAKTGRVVINDNPINRFCFDNAVLDTDRIENCKPVKRAANMEIDGVIAMLMCMRLFIDCER